jgi:hypothetical protein
VHAAAGDLQTPAAEVPVAVREIAERAPGQRIALDVVHPALLDLALVLRRAGTTRRDQETVMLGKVTVAALDLGIVERRVDDRGAEIVEVMWPARLCGRRHQPVGVGAAGLARVAT